MSNPFRPVYRELSDAEKERVEQIKDTALSLYLQINPGVPGEAKERARYKALAVTALEEAVMWATKAVST